MTVFGRGGTAKKEKVSPSSATPPGAAKPTALVDAVTAPQKGFGIRSYLHQFYQSPNAEDLESSGAWYLLPPPPAHRRGLYICRILTVVGLLLLIGGAVAIVVGYTWPHEGVEESIIKIAIYQDEDGSFYVPPEKLSEVLKDPMRHWKMAGLCVFAGGAVVLAVSMLVPTCAQWLGAKRLAAFASGDATPNEPPIRIYPAAPQKGDQAAGKQGSAISTSGPVPVMEEVAKVQPSDTKESKSGPSADDLLLGDSEQ